MITTPPNSNEVEITLIGTGGGYGESIVIKYGVDSWAIIDSCINPFTKEPLALEYLNKIKVDLKNVKVILCTHWHNDHIKGISNILSLCPNAEFFFSDVNDIKQFLLLLELDSSKSKKGSKSATDELNSCLEILCERDNPYYTQVKSDSLIEKLNVNGTTFDFYALSPSPKICNDYKTEISELITEYGKRTSPLINKTPNDKSVAVLFCFGENSVLLGADLEIGKSEFEGWQYIVKHSKVISDKKINLYKLPHHGSENGYLESIFDVLVNKNSTLKTTPFKTHGLPSKYMIDVYLSHSDNVFLTSEPMDTKKQKKRDKSLSKFIEKNVKEIYEIKFSHGIVRSRIDYTNKKAVWQTDVFDSAVKL